VSRLCPGIAMLRSVDKFDDMTGTGLSFLLILSIYVQVRAAGEGVRGEGLRRLFRGHAAGQNGGQARGGVILVVCSCHVVALAVD
jgi:hypothetical protein